MRILFVLFASLLMCSMVGCGDIEDETSETGVEEKTSETGSSLLSVDWHALEQYQRSEKILLVALDDYGDNVGKSCKEWVRDVIRRATDGHVKIPPNTLEGDGWDPDPVYDHVVRYRYNVETALLGTTPGDIVQMQWKAGVGSTDPKFNMHTAIVLFVFQHGVIFIESNYDDTPTDESDAFVGIRFVSEKEFQEKVEAFSVYTIR